MDPKVDEFIRKTKRWQEEMQQLRMIILDCGLSEELKWYQPCYTFQNRNVLIIGAFKKYCALSFFKGALLKDGQGILSKPGEHSQAVRLIRFTKVSQIIEMEPVLKAYIKEAVAVEKAGLKVDFKAKTELNYPEELQEKLEENPALKTAFEALTPGRQRGYILYFSAPKQPKTRTSRIERCIPRILDGKGINDR